MPWCTYLHSEVGGGGGGGFKQVEGVGGKNKKRWAEKTKMN